MIRARCAALRLLVASSGTVVLAIVSAVAPLRAQTAEVQAGPPATAADDVSLEQYRAHLADLHSIIGTCAQARNVEACDPALVGDDDRVTLGSGAQAQARVVRYDWVRQLLSRAQEPDNAPKAAAESPVVQLGPQEKTAATTTSQLLKDAQDRLNHDIDQANHSLQAEPRHDSERAVLEQVLAGKEFRNLKQPDGKQSAMEKFGNWLNNLFEGLGKLRPKAAWVGAALFWGFIMLVGVGLALLLVQLERRWRVRLLPESEVPAPTAASARDWQLWLKDARDAAARREWREAIHFMYWAAISRLESKKLWPADRARTPREYLALVAADDPRKAGLGALTREFEWTWYGGRYAGEEEYQRAEELATGLFETGAAHSGGSPR